MTSTTVAIHNDRSYTEAMDGLTVFFHFATTRLLASELPDARSIIIEHYCVLAGQRY